MGGTDAAVEVGFTIYLYNSYICFKFKAPWAWVICKNLILHSAHWILIITCCCDHELSSPEWHVKSRSQLVNNIV
jgi:hypothetical protein